MKDVDKQAFIYQTICMLMINITYSEQDKDEDNLMIVLFSAQLGRSHIPFERTWFGEVSLQVTEQQGVGVSK